MAEFTGFGPEGLPFLKALAFHQSKEWFEANRAIYERDLKTPLAELVEALAARFAEEGIALEGDAKGSVFRLNRDIRFSKDKSPYKTHVGATLTRTGVKMDPTGLLYIHIDPKGSFVAAGFHMPEPPQLLAMRSAIRATPSGWQKMVAALEKGGLRLGDSEMASRLPRGFEDMKGSPVEDALRLKNYIAEVPLAEADLARPALVDTIADFARRARPLLDYGARALG